MTNIFLNKQTKKYAYKIDNYDEQGYTLQLFDYYNNVWKPVSFPYKQFWRAQKFAYDKNGIEIAEIGKVVYV